MGSFDQLLYHKPMFDICPIQFLMLKPTLLVLIKSHVFYIYIGSNKQLNWIFHEFPMMIVPAVSYHCS